jgi:hypothetical protein
MTIYNHSPSDTWTPKTTGVIPEFATWVLKNIPAGYNWRQYQPFHTRTRLVGDLSLCTGYLYMYIYTPGLDRARCEFTVLGGYLTVMITTGSLFLGEKWLTKWIFREIKKTAGFMKRSGYRKGVWGGYLNLFKGSEPRLDRYLHQKPGLWNVWVWGTPQGTGMITAGGLVLACCFCLFVCLFLPD